MKAITLFLLAVSMTGLAVAQTPAKPAPAAKASAKAAAKPSPSRTEIRSTASQLAAGIEAAEAALTPAELAIAQRVHVGRLPCELGAFVQITPDAKAPGYFDVQVGKVRYRMFPVESRTGAIRLEDSKSEALWLQLANKSMLINRKLGQRMADACMSPEQTAVAAAMEKSPPPSILDAPRAAAPAGGASGTAAASAPQVPASAVAVPATPLPVPPVTVAQPAPLPAPASVPLPAHLAAPQAAPAGAPDSPVAPARSPEAATPSASPASAAR